MPYEVWCRAHIEAAGRLHDKAYPRYVCRTKREAESKCREADRECQSGADHFIKKGGTDGR